jgi:hypothetical protein
MPAQHDFLGIGIVDIEQLLELRGKIDRRLGRTLTLRQPPEGAVSTKFTAVPRRSY